MEEILKNIDWVTVIEVIWRVVLLPIVIYLLTEINNYAKEKKINHYTDIVLKLAKIAAKTTYETFVKDIKGTDVWTETTQQEALDLAKDEILNALSDSAIEMLETANKDFELWVENAIESAIYDLKREGKANE